MPPEMAHLCPVRAYAAWIEATDCADGPVFRKLDKFDKIVEPAEPMVSFISWSIYFMQSNRRQKNCSTCSAII
jgi:hypothetical protein